MELSSPTFCTYLHFLNIWCQWTKSVWAEARCAIQSAGLRTGQHQNKKYARRVKHLFHGNSVYYQDAATYTAKHNWMTQSKSPWHGLPTIAKESMPIANKTNQLWTWSSKHGFAKTNLLRVWCPVPTLLIVHGELPEFALLRPQNHFLQCVPDEEFRTLYYKEL